MSEETWGPWTEHVPGPCPVPVGTWVQVEDTHEVLEPFRVQDGRVPCGTEHPSWIGEFGFRPILRYRVRMDREHSGMSVLRSLLNGIPVKETEDA